LITRIIFGDEYRSLSFAAMFKVKYNLYLSTLKREAAGFS
jgi:hypothetical protein